MKFDENLVFIKFHQSSIFIFKTWIFDEPVKKTNKLIELDRIGLDYWMILKTVLTFKQNK